jgi:hypothetical protein
MKIAIFTGAVTISLFYLLAIVEAQYGPDVPRVAAVADRFLEKSPRHTAEYMRDWVEKYPDAARRYAFPVLFPLDLLFMIFLGGYLGLGSVLTADTIDWLKRFARLFAIIPAVYVLADLVEDTLLARLLLDVQAIDDASVWWPRVATGVKLAAAGLAIFQTIVVSGVAAICGR